MKNVQNSSEVYTLFQDIREMLMQIIFECTLKKFSIMCEQSIQHEIDCSHLDDNGEGTNKKNSGSFFLITV